MPHRDRVVLATFFDLGWRAKEASMATLDDVDLRGRYVTIRKENVKVFRGRVVGLNSELARLLSAWIERWRPPVPHLYLFVSDDGRQFSPEGMRQMFRRLAKAAGIPPELARSSPHTCRHYFAVQWARSHPGDLAGLQRVLGHSSIRTTQIYFQRAEDLGAVERQQHMRSNWRS
jgi:site-specific recombinase XerD